MTTDQPTKKERIAYENGQMDAIEDIIRYAENSDVSREQLIMLAKASYSKHIAEYARLKSIEVL